MSYANDMPATMVRTDSGLASELRIGVMRLGRRLRLERSDDAMSLNQLAVMGTLERHGRMSDRRARRAREGSAAVDDAHGRVPGGVRSRRGGRRTRPTAARWWSSSPTSVGTRVIADRREREAWLAQRLEGTHEGRARRAALGGPDLGTAGRLVSPTFRALAIHNYRLYFLGSLVTNTGTWMQRVAQDWLVVTDLGAGGVGLGLTTGLQFLPFLLVTPFAGVLADRFPKRRPADDHAVDHGGGVPGARACS